LAEYAQPICVDNLDIDTTYANEHYHSDLIFPEEKQANDVNQGNDTMIENDTSNG
jgi:hypothetical protein